jgi:hypothetical protein
MVSSGVSKMASNIGSSGIKDMAKSAASSALNAGKDMAKDALKETASQAMNAGSDFMKGKANEYMDKGREALVGKLPSSVGGFADNLLKKGQDSLSNKMDGFS